MRHLSVPSAQTQRWLELCRAHNWSSNEAGVTRLEGGRNALPLNDSAPDAPHQVWEGNPHVEVSIQPKEPNHWLSHLDPELALQFEGFWPRSYEVQGDVLIVKIEPEVWDYGETIADAMLTQLPNVRLVCADLGVKGEFRVRDLHPLASRDGTVTTRTRIKENGYLLWVDPSEVYFSSRLSNERRETLETAKRLRARLERPLVVCDPYAGVGPSMGALLNENGLVSGGLVGDLNPQAFTLLEMNIAYLSSRQKDANGNSMPALKPMVVSCQDAQEWAQNADYIATVDLLLVNLPHHSIEHLPGVLPLLKTNQTTVLRGWAIVETASTGKQHDEIHDAIHALGGVVEAFSFKEVTGFSTTKSFMCFEVWLNLPA